MVVRAGRRSLRCRCRAHSMANESAMPHAMPSDACRAWSGRSMPRQDVPCPADPIIADPVYPAMWDYEDNVYYCPCCSARLKLYQIHELGFGTIEEMK